MYVNFDDVFNIIDIVNKDILGVFGRNNYEVMIVLYLFLCIIMFIIGDI